MRLKCLVDNTLKSLDDNTLKSLDDNTLGCPRRGLACELQCQCRACTELQRVVCSLFSVRSSMARTRGLFQNHVCSNTYQNRQYIPDTCMLATDLRLGTAQNGVPIYGPCCQHLAPMVSCSRSYSFGAWRPPQSENTESGTVQVSHKCMRNQSI